MKQKLFPAALIAAALCTGPVSAQKSPDIAMTAIDDLIVCTLVYGRTSQLYSEQGKMDQSKSFQETSMAYGTVANTVIDTTFAPDVAIGYIDRRMKTLMGSLNASAEAHKDGDLGVIEEWLDYCDGMGPRVQSTLDALENVGRF